MNCCWQPQPLAVVAALGELRQVLAAVRAVVLAAVHQPLAVVAALEEVHQVLAAVRADQTLVVVAALGELRQVFTAVRAVVLAVVVVAALEEVRQPLALRAAMLAAVESCFHQALAWSSKHGLQHQPLAVQHPRHHPRSIHHPAYLHHMLPRRRHPASSTSRWWRCSKQHQHQARCRRQEQPPQTLGKPQPQPQPKRPQLPRLVLRTRSRMVALSATGFLTRMSGRRSVVPNAGCVTHRSAREP